LCIATGEGARRAFAVSRDEERMDSVVQDAAERMDSAQVVPDFSDPGANRLFGELLVSKGLLTQEELAEGLDTQRQEGGRLGEILLRLDLLGDTDITHALAEHLSICPRASPSDSASWLWRRTTAESS